MNIQSMPEGEEFPGPRSDRITVSVYFDPWEKVIPEMLAKGLEVLVPSVPSSLAVSMSELFEYPIYVQINPEGWSLLFLPKDSQTATRAPAS